MFRNIIANKELIIALARKEINKRYKQSALGWLWSIIKPLLIVLTFTFLFGNLSKLDSLNTPYPLMVFSGLLPWELFANVITRSTSSILSYKKLVISTGVPSIIFPIVCAISCLFEFLIIFILMIFMFIGFNWPLRISIFLYPILTLCILFSGLSFGLWFAKIAVWYRDIKFTISNLLQMMLLLTPVGYNVISLPKSLSFISSINPLTPLINTSRYLLLGINPPSIQSIFYSLIFFSIIFISGFSNFQRNKNKFADIV